MAEKRPEIELEVSCGGTFKIVTEAMACRITVIEPPAKGQASFAPPPPPPPEIREKEVRVPDPFYSAIVADACREFCRVAAELAPGRSRGAEAIIAARKEIGELAGRAAGVQDAFEADLGRAQGKLADLRFALTFLKNHPLFSRETEGDADTEVTVSRRELQKLLAKIISGVKGLQAANDGISRVRAACAKDDPEQAMAFVDRLAGAGRSLAEMAFTLAAQHEAKQQDANLDPDRAARMASSRLDGIRAAEAPVASQNDGAAAGQDLIDQLMGGGSSSSSAGGSEMSDDEALAKLKEFGL